MAAFILLRVGLGGSDSPDELDACSCSFSRVFPCETIFDSPFLSISMADLAGGW
jgi:hypothetical protein